jgi:hypothetical protein
VPVEGVIDSRPDGSAELEAPAPLFVTSAHATIPDAEPDIDGEPDSVADGDSDSDSDSSSDEVADGDSEADPPAAGALSTIANGDASSVLVDVATMVIDPPPASGVSWNGGPGTADGGALAVSALPLGAELPPVVMLAAALDAPLESLGADIEAGAPLDSDPPDIAPLAPGDPDVPAIRSVHDPCSRTAGIPSIAPVLTVIWTWVVPSG